MRDAAEVRPERSEHTPVLYCLLVEVNLHVCVMVVVAGTQTPVLRSRSPHSEDSHRDATIRNAERKANRRCDRLVAEKLALPTGTQEILFLPFTQQAKGMTSFVALFRVTSCACWETWVIVRRRTKSCCWSTTFLTRSSPVQCSNAFPSCPGSSHRR